MQKPLQFPVFRLKDINNGLMMQVSPIETFPTHTHMYNEMVVYQPFKGFISINEKKIRVDSPTIALVNTSSFHSTFSEDKNSATCLKISFTNQMINNCFSNILTSPIVLTNYTAYTLLCTLIKKIKCQTDGEYIKILLNAILIELCEHGSKIRSAAKMNINRHVASAVNIINENFVNDISLQSVAGELHITPQYLSHIFSEYMGVSFSQYLSDFRLRYAANLLIRQDLNITEICYLSGYRNLSHFIRSFKAKYSKTPNDFRR